LNKRDDHDPHREDVKKL
jgi:hypothetical protein